ncbi:hypothetical protein CROQUDRAFT_652635 [Cronartium quercuum f. sp. fusiforme G11]|uniref:LIM zinc-binding domain-containing protein n=1 Tax=Cronartium quercuum f. sp. fusiforme G11 TaxID=708437 RepID=A0A9P6NU07_9BASI|nr:hypothetical protein CROQUDRAFT_652635 [Cronartium quercuum f. sp. fusiforme G11]
MAGFCRRCGDIIRGPETRCKCGGSSASSQVSRALFEPTKPDRWLKTYGEKRSASPATVVASARVPSRAQSTQPLQIAPHPASRPAKSSAPAPASDDVPTTQRRTSLADRSINTLPVQIVTPPTPLKQPVPPQSDPTPKRGLSVKSSARAHVRSLTANMPDSVDLSAAEEEVLTNVFGSVLDPHETRGRCGLCTEVFKREGKIFPDPRREEPGGEWAGVFYCRGCYTKAFSRGSCGSCGKVVVGDEGFIQLGKGGGRGLWHKKCFRCVHCNADVSGSPSVDLRGEPCCDDCFDRPTKGSLPSSSSVTDIPDLRLKPVRHALNHSPATRALRPAVEELRSKLQRAGIEKAPPVTPVLSSSTSTSAVPTTGLRSTTPSKTTSMPNFSALSKPCASPSTPTRSARPGPREAGPHVLSPSANPMCTKCSLPLFASLTRGAVNLATLPTTGETYHLDCLSCDSCNGAFQEGKYTLLDNEKLCDVCVARKDVAAAEARLKEFEAGWKRSAAAGKGQGLARTDVERSFPTSPVVVGPALLAKKVSGSPFLGGGGVSEVPKITGQARFGGQSICPGCLKPGTIQETRVGPKNERWHGKCLRCGGCGKALDSGAKRFEDSGKVGCRDCLDKERVLLRGGRM